MRSVAVALLGAACVTDPLRLASAETPAPTAVYAKTRFVWIRREPSWSSPWLGYLWIGGSVALASPRPVYALGCERWYAVVPRGFVCVDERRATLNAADPEYVAVASHAPDFESPTPHRYAESLGTPVYFSLPTDGEEHAREPDLGVRQGLLSSASAGGVRDASIAGVDLTAATVDAVAFSSLPADIQMQRNVLPHGATVAYTDEYRYGGRSWLLTSDFSWVPKDRVRPYAPSPFQGVTLDDATRLPLAFFREHDRPAFRRTDHGDFASVQEGFRRLTWAPLTGRKEAVGGATYLETTRDGLWVLATDAVVPVPSERTPWGARVGEPDDSRARPAGRATWLEVSVYGGWLIAYEGTRPVFATLMSPGRGGAATKDRDTIRTASTPVGRFSVSGKFVTATMDARGGQSHAEVPWTQNFSGPHAIHTAYWHDAWGERASGGCVNVSPRDGKWLFDFSEPELPRGWYGVRSDASAGGSTIVMIHR